MLASEPDPEGQIGREDPRSGEVRGLIEAHLAFAHATTPPEDINALGPDELLDPAIVLYGLRAGDRLLSIGALKELDPEHAELKCMHTAEAERGRGIGRAMLEHLLAVARERGFPRVSLETGSTPAFVPARTLYASVGFVVCGPFGDYPASSNNTFMTLALVP